MAPLFCEWPFFGMTLDGIPATCGSNVWPMGTAEDTASYSWNAIHRGSIAHRRCLLSLFLPVGGIIRTISFRVTDDTYRRLRQWSKHHCVPWSRAVRYMLDTVNWETDPAARQKRSRHDRDYISPMARFARIIQGKER
jgi:hypothetical protein